MSRQMGDLMWELEDKGRATNLLRTHLFVVFDFIFGDDAIGLLGLLPGELDAALLHVLFDDLADFERGYSDRTISISGRQTLPACTCIRPTTNQPQRLLHLCWAGLLSWLNIHKDASTCLRHMIKISIYGANGVATASGKKCNMLATNDISVQLIPTFSSSTHIFPCDWAQKAS